jgi:hypothetical protein
VDPVPDPLLLRKSGSAGNGTGPSGSVARNSDHRTQQRRSNWSVGTENMSHDSETVMFLSPAKRFNYDYLERGLSENRIGCLRKKLKNYFVKGNIVSHKVTPS